jgi:diguanylate cyclase (GGDEF)-like protein
MECKLLLVDDNPAMIQLMARELSGFGELRFATRGELALQQVRGWHPDLILLDAEMPGMDGFQVCETVKADPELRDIPVIFVTGHDTPEAELHGLDVGAVDFIAKPISEPLLVARVRTQLRVKALTDELRRIATIDALTEVANRRSFDAVLEREWARGRRDGQPISLLLIDVDHFKRYNDRYGHPAGDTCLHAVAQALRRHLLRPADFVARYGGEEFAVLLPQTDDDGADLVAQRLLEAVSSLRIAHDGSDVAPHVTVSIGIASHLPASPGACAEATPPRPGAADGAGHLDLLRSADQALYAAKRAGRARRDHAGRDPVGPARDAADALATAGELATAAG